MHASHNKVPSSNIKIPYKPISTSTYCRKRKNSDDADDELGEFLKDPKLSKQAATDAATAFLRDIGLDVITFKWVTRTKHIPHVYFTYIFI